MKEFETIYRDNFEKVFYFLFKLSSDNDLSEELTQETFYKAFVSFDKFNGGSSIYTWLVAIAKNTYFSYLKKNKRRLDMASLDNFLDADSIADNGESAEDSVIKSDDRRRINEHIRALPEKYRDVVVLRIYGDLSFKQVAQALEITENSAKVIYHRAIYKLKEHNHEFEL